jgi:hypothetical protein
MRSWSCREVSKTVESQSVWRTLASASLKVSRGLRYQDACRGRAPASASSAHSVTSENKPIRAGVVRAIASSDHWRWVSTPR